MSLRDYHAKRRFETTPEPTGGQGSGPLRFVIQKHAASHLHYDFRLEMGGVLKSWAVPKGPSLNPADKHLAMQTEDHPYDYRAFEGIIPQGNYGAGTVMLWDEGTYEPLFATGDREEDDKLAREGVHREHLTFILHGAKLNGEFALIKMKHADEEGAWLLVKADKDEFVTKDDVTTQDRSVVTGRNLDEIAASKPITKLHLAELADAPITKQLPEPTPMLATLAKSPFDDPNWLYEIKWDGYRIMTETAPTATPKLHSRRGQDYTQYFQPVADDFAPLHLPTLIDGEMTVVDSDGRPDFQDLQNYLRTGHGQLQYFVFDLLHLAGHDLTTLPLTRRKALAQRVLGLISSPRLKFSDHIVGQGSALLASARTKGLEGIIAKRAESLYQPGHRSRDWLKLKTHHRQEAVIVGYTQPRAGRQYFGALVLGLYDAAGQLIYAGHTGSGITDATLRDLHDRLQPLVVAQSPIQPEPATNEPATWVRPELVCEVEFTEWTDDGSMRHPIFAGLREDKPAKEVKREEAISNTATVKEPYKEEEASMQKKGSAKLNTSRAADAGSGAHPDEASGPRSSASEKHSAQQNKAQPKTLSLAQRKGEVTLKLNGHNVTITHPDKIYFPEDKITKAEIIDYYRSVADVILPQLKDRPESLHRYPEGIHGHDFYHKDLEDHPSWVKTKIIHSESAGKDIHFLIVNDEATLVYMANLGCIDINPWNSRTTSLDNPDWCVIDLDPEDIGFDAVIQTAQAVHEVLDELKIPSYPKTSGATGLHIYIPTAAKYNYDQVRLFAELIANLVHQRLPKVTSIERSPARRQGKIYLDYLQNRHGQTLASAYSVRPRPGAPVSTPLAWDEVTAGLHPSQFTLRNTHDRLTLDAKLWQPVLGPGIDLNAVLKNLTS